jgi:hypothetical protein
VGLAPSDTLHGPISTLRLLLLEYFALAAFNEALPALRVILLRVPHVHIILMSEGPARLAGMKLS